MLIYALCNITENRNLAQANWKTKFLQLHVETSITFIHTKPTLFYMSRGHCKTRLNPCPGLAGFLLVSKISLFSLYPQKSQHILKTSCLAANFPYFLQRANLNVFCNSRVENVLILTISLLPASQNK